MDGWVQRRPRGAGKGRGACAEDRSGKGFTNGEAAKGGMDMLWVEVLIHDLSLSLYLSSSSSLFAQFTILFAVSFYVGDNKFFCFLSMFPSAY